MIGLEPTTSGRQQAAWLAMSQPFGLAVTPLRLFARPGALAN